MDRNQTNLKSFTTIQCSEALVFFISKLNNFICLFIIMDSVAQAYYSSIISCI